MATTLILGNLFTVKMICLKNTCIHSLKWCTIYLKRRILTGYSFFKHAGFVWRISLTHPLFQVKCFFNGAVGAMHSFRGYIEATVFDSSYLLTKLTFMENFRRSMF